MSNRITSAFLSILSGQTIVMILSILLTPILVRLLGSSNYGDYAFVLSVITLAMIIVNAGINNSLRKFVAEKRDIANWENYVFGFYVRLGFILALLGSLPFILLNSFGATDMVFDSNIVIYFYIVPLILFARLSYYIARSALMGKHLEHISEALKVIKQITFTILAVSVAYLGYSVTGVLLTHVISAAFITGIGLYFISRHYSLNFIFRPTGKEVPKKKLLLYNVNTVVLIFLFTTLYEIDILLLQPISGSTQTGYYKSALIIAEFLWFVPFVLQTALVHSVSDIWSNNDYDKLSDLSSRITRYNLCLAVLLVVGLSCLAQPFMTLYFGSEFEAAVIPLLLLLPGALGYAITHPIIAIGQGRRNLKPIVYATSIAAITNIILNVILIPIYGMYGAAIATSIGYGSMPLLHGYTARKIGYDPFNDLRLSRIAITGVATFAVIFPLASLIQNSVLSLIVVPPIGLIIYSTLALKLRIVDPEEAINFTNNLPDPISYKVANLVNSYT